MHTDRTHRTPLRLALLVVGASLLAACGGSGGQQSQVLVSAASSLTDAFAAIEEDFEVANPEIDILLNLGGSALLREQILGGAPIDVFASANSMVMQTVVEAGFASEPTTFARNQLAIGVPSNNPAGVAGIEDFADESLLIGLCAEAVPCGSLAREVLIAADIDAAIDTSEADVRSLLTKLELGELDAGIVYSTDIMASRDVTGFEIPDSLNPSTDYPIAVITGAPGSEGARKFVAFVLSAKGRQILTAHGFATP